MISCLFTSALSNSTHSKYNFSLGIFYLLCECSRHQGFCCIGACEHKALHISFIKHTLFTLMIDHLKCSNDMIFIIKHGYHHHAFCYIPCLLVYILVKSFIFIYIFDNDFLATDDSTSDNSRVDRQLYRIYTVSDLGPNMLFIITDDPYTTSVCTCKCTTHICQYNQNIIIISRRRHLCQVGKYQFKYLIGIECPCMLHLSSPLFCMIP